MDLPSYCNREQFSETFKKTALAKRYAKYFELSPRCKICDRDLTFEEFAKGKRDFCGSKECRSIVNSKNSLKQDKSKISQQIKNSEKWIEGQRKLLNSTASRIEKCFVQIFKDLYGSAVSTQYPIKLSDGSNKFIDIAIDGVFIEIDGPFHSDTVNAPVDQYCLDNNIKLIRIPVVGHWIDIMSRVGKYILQIEHIRNNK